MVTILFLQFSKGPKVRGWALPPARAQRLIKESLITAVTPSGFTKTIQKHVSQVGPDGFIPGTTYPVMPRIAWGQAASFTA